MGFQCKASVTLSPHIKPSRTMEMQQPWQRSMKFTSRIQNPSAIGRFPYTFWDIILSFCEESRQIKSSDRQNVQRCFATELTALTLNV
jgi:hypothetical protein